MKKILLSGLLIILGFFVVSCGDNSTVRQDNTTNITSSSAQNVVTNEVVKPTYDRMKDLSYSNAVTFLQESLEKENITSSPENKLNSGKAFLLLLKVLKERYTQFGSQGFEKVGFSVQEFENYRNVSKMKFIDVLSDTKSTPEMKSEAQSRQVEVDGLSLK